MATVPICLKCVAGIKFKVRVYICTKITQVDETQYLVYCLCSVFISVECQGLGNHHIMFHNIFYTNFLHLDFFVIGVVLQFDFTLSCVELLFNVITQLTGGCCT